MASSVQELEALLAEFYSNVSQARRHEIEKRLNAIRAEPQSWSFVKPIMTSTSSNAVQFFALSIVECHFAGRWKLIPNEARIELRDFLTSYLITKFMGMSHVVLQKLVKVVVSIQAHSWPAGWPEYMHSVLSLCSNPATALLGLYLIKSTSEECTSARNDLKSKRKAKIKEILTQQVPGIITQVLTPTLQSVLAQQQTPELLQLGKGALEAMRHLFSWAPLSDLLQPQHLDVLFACINKADDLSLIAFDCLNEIMNHNYVPTQHIQFIGQILSLVFEFLQRITAAGPQQVNSEFVTKFTEFTSLFVKNHMNRRLPFQLGQFLSLLLTYTAYQTKSDGFLMCLDIWDDLVEFLQIQTQAAMPALNNEASTSTEHFIGPTVDLVDQLVDRIMFGTNAAVLTTLDAEDPTDAGSGTTLSGIETRSLEETMSDLMTFQTRCLNLISGVLSLFPQQAVARLGPKLMAILGKIGQVQAAIGSRSEEVLYAVKDICMALRVLGSTMMNLVDNFPSNYELGRSVLSGVVQFTQHCNDSKLYSLGQEASLIHAEAFDSLRASALWLSVFLSTAMDVSRDMLPQFEFILQSCVNTAAPIFKEIIPDKVALSAAKLLRSIFESIHHPTVLKMVMNIGGSDDPFKLISFILNGYSLPVQEEIFTAICESLVLPWSHTQQQEWQMREQQLVAVVGPICEPVVQVSSNPGELAAGRQEVVAILHRACSILSAMLRAVKQRHLTKVSLEILSRNLVPTFGASLGLLIAATNNYALLERLVSYHMSALDVFSTVMDTKSLDIVIQSYLSLLQQNGQLETLFSGKDKTAVVMAQATMRMLELIVQLPFNPLIGQLITYIIEHVSPAVKKSSSAAPLFDLYYQAVMRHDSTVQHNPMVSSAIYADFLWALEQQDIETYRTVLLHLEELARRRHFFNSATFMSNFYRPYLGTLFSTAIQGTHKLLWEQISDVIFSIVKVNIDAFYNEVAASLFQSPVFGQIAPQQQASLMKAFGRPTDLASFRKSIEIVVDDYSFFLRTNNPLPQL